MSELEDLRKELQDLKTQVSTVSRRLTELDSTMSDHVGLDWGETLTDINSPHPNISANTIESGGGIIRQDINGMQVATGGQNTPTLAFVETLQPDPFDADVLVSMTGNIDESDGEAWFSLRALDRDPPTASITAATLTLETFGNDRTNASLEATVDSDDSSGGAKWSKLVVEREWSATGTGSIELWQAVLRLVPSQQSGFPFTVDPSNAQEGDIWYNTTDNQFKFYEGSTIKTLGGGGMTVKVKEADETLSTNTTLQNDDELLFAVAANEVWQFEGVLFVATNGTADIKIAFTGPTGAVGGFGILGFGSGGNDNHEANSLGSSVNIVATATDGVEVVRFFGGIHNGANAGNLTLQWAQVTSSGSTVVKAGSYIKYVLADN